MPHISRKINSSARYDRRFFDWLFAELRDLHLPEIVVFLPHQDVPIQERTLLAGDFLKLTRKNLGGFVVRANGPNAGLGTVVRVMVSIGDSGAHFSDDMFSEVRRSTGSIDVSSPLATDAYSLSGYLQHEIFSHASTAPGRLGATLLLVAAMFLLLEIVTTGLARRFIHANIMVDAVLGAAALVCVLLVLFMRRGVSLSTPVPRSHVFERLMRGSLKDNPILIVIIAALGIILGGLGLEFSLRMLGWKNTSAHAVNTRSGAQLDSVERTVPPHTPR